jgi:flavin reductase (DIM6/NTAB) family NADH-FMN oxidoreductase RutF
LNDASERTALSEALGRIPSGLFVVTVREPDGDRETAFLASWVMQAGFDPPSITVGVGSDRAARPWMDAPGGRFAVSVIADAEKGQVGPFARGVEPGANALDACGIERTPSGLGVVPGCLAWVECGVRGSVASGDHVVVLGEITAARGGRTDAPAVHVRADGLRY